MWYAHQTLYAWCRWLLKWLLTKYLTSANQNSTHSQKKTKKQKQIKHAGGSLLLHIFTQSTNIWRLQRTRSKEICRTLRIITRGRLLDKLLWSGVGRRRNNNWFLLKKDTILFSWTVLNCYKQKQNRRADSHQKTSQWHRPSKNTKKRAQTVRERFALLKILVPTEIFSDPKPKDLQYSVICGTFMPPPKKSLVQDGQHLVVWRMQTSQVSELTLRKIKIIEDPTSKISMIIQALQMISITPLTRV